MNLRFALLISVAFAIGIGIGGYLFNNTQPRSFLAVFNCQNSCYRPKDLAGLLASAGIRRPVAYIPNVARETDRCVAIYHPFATPGRNPDSSYHFVIFPKKDVKNIADVSIDDQPYIFDCLAVIRSLITEYGITNYRVYTNGPELQDVAYLHFHLVTK